MLTNNRKQSTTFPGQEQEGATSLKSHFHQFSIPQRASLPLIHVLWSLLFQQRAFCLLQPTKICKIDAKQNYVRTKSYSQIWQNSHSCFALLLMVITIFSIRSTNLERKKEKRKDNCGKIDIKSFAEKPDKIHTRQQSIQRAI